MVCRNDGSNLLVHVTFCGGSFRRGNKISGSKTSGECGDCGESIIYRAFHNVLRDYKHFKVKQSRYRPGVTQRVPGS
jgi:hypothetical protein